MSYPHVTQITSATECRRDSRLLRHVSGLLARSGPIGWLALAALALTAAALLAAGTADAATKGLAPGTWKGTGVFSGSISDGVATTTFGGKLGFRFVIAKNRAVKGTGSWVKTMTGTGVVSSELTGVGVMMFGGHAANIGYIYTEEVEGTMTANGRPSPMKFVLGDDKVLKGRLVVTALRKCTASGVIPAGGGLKITWSARRVGCRG